VQRTRPNGVRTYLEAGGARLEGDHDLWLITVRDVTPRVQTYQRLAQRASERAGELTTLLNVSTRIASTLKLEPLLRPVLEQLQTIVDFDAAAVYTLKTPSALRRLAYTGSLPAGVWPQDWPLSSAPANREVVERQQPVVVPDAAADSPAARRVRAQMGEAQAGIRAWMGIPLVARNRVIGMIVFGHPTAGYYTSRHADLAFAFANQVAVALENARLYRQEFERRQVAEGLREILDSLNSNMPLGEVLDEILEQAEQLLGAQASAIYRTQPDERMLIVQAARGLPDDYGTQMSMAPGEGAIGAAVAEHRPVHVLDLAAEHSKGAGHTLRREAIEAELAARFQTLLAVPMYIRDTVYGGIVFFYEEPRAFAEGEIELASAFCDQAALALENTRLRAQAAQAATAAERQRIARELHDAVTQTLFSANLIAEVLPQIWEQSQPEFAQRLEDLRRLTRGALAEMRMLLLELRPAALAEAPLGDLVRQLVEAVTARARLDVALHVQGNALLPPDVQATLYRIAQEALNNVVKHARATRLEVYVIVAPDSFELRIYDNGRGFDPEQVTGEHFGLRIMRERAAGIGAALQIISAPGQGTRVLAAWPTADEEAE